MDKKVKKQKSKFIRQWEDITAKLKSAPAMPDYWRMGYNSKEEMEDAKNVRQPND